MPPINFTNANTNYEKIAASATVVDICAEHGSRIGLMIYNSSTSSLYCRVDGTASLTDYSFIVPPASSYEMPIQYYTDKVTGIWGAANGHAFVTEIRNR